MPEVQIKPLTLNFGPQHPAAHERPDGCDARRGVADGARGTNKQVSHQPEHRASRALVGQMSILLSRAVRWVSIA